LGFENVVDLSALEEDSDVRALVVDRHISVTPLTWDFSVGSPAVEALVDSL
jgi:hypothetical protein